MIAHLPGTGRLSNLMGALQVSNEAGVVFKIGSGFTDMERRNPPEIGCKVTYKF